MEFLVYEFLLYKINFFHLYHQFYPSSDDHFEFAGLNAKPLKIKIKDPDSLRENSEIKDFVLKLIDEQNTTNSMWERSRIFDRFIVSRSFSNSEVCHPDLYQNSLVDFKDGQLYQDGKLLTTPDTIWALSPHSILCIYPLNKSYLLAGRPHPNHSLFFQKDGIGLPVACAGHIEVLEGKIKKITNATGHYMVTLLQLILTLPYFYEKGVLSDDLKIEFPYSTERALDLRTLLFIADIIELDNSLED